MPYQSEGPGTWNYLVRLTGKTLFILGLVLLVLGLLSGFWPAPAFILLLLLGAALLSAPGFAPFKMVPVRFSEERVRGALLRAFSPPATRLFFHVLKTALLTFLALTAASVLLLLLAQGPIKKRDTRADGREMTGALQRYYQKTGRYPASLSELIGNNPMRQGWKSDGWGRAYQYRLSPDGTDYLLTSAGSDGRFRTGDDLVFHY
ncbi:type II secretion system protein GspG [Paraflavisolibacter sp. H34]|uniref:type II secretion system protein GspG n=1 Tax=Huijunlia imazamoxiresistens TaxID=3127457 RepID=UPI003017CEFF